jgi:hypothetical protein
MRYIPEIILNSEIYKEGYSLLTIYSQLLYIQLHV